MKTPVARTRSITRARELSAAEFRDELLWGSITVGVMAMICYALTAGMDYLFL